MRDQCTEALMMNFIDVPIILYKILSFSSLNIYIYSIIILSLILHNQIERALLDKQTEKEYAGILGYPAFHKAAAEFALTKEERVVKENMVCVTINKN